MSVLKQTQFLFTKGEVGPYMEARADTNIYKAGLRTCNNFLILPQGGIKRRPGFKFVDDHPETVGAGDNGFHASSRLIPFNYGNEQEYVLVFEPNKVHIYKSDLYQATVTDGASSNVCPWDATTLPEIRYAQTLDTLLIVHKDFRPVKLVRGASHTAWTARNLDFDYVPLVNHSFDSNIQVDAVANHSNGNPNVSFGANVKLTITSGSYDWTAGNWPTGHINQHISLNGGTAKIHQVDSDTVAYCTVEEEMVNDDNVENDAWEIDAFSNLSSTYGGGWPRSVSFHQNRLVFGGSRDNPQTIFGSQSGSFYNFKPTTKVVEIEKTTTTTGGNSTISTEEHILGQVTDDAGFSFTIASDEVSIIYHLVSTQQLYIFASSGEWLMEGSPVTPTSVSINRQTNYGIMNNGHKPVMVDTEAMFLSNNTELRAFSYNYNTDGYTAKNYTLVSHHILDNPIDIAAVRSFADTNSNYVFVVNSSGNLGCMSVNVEKDVLGWSRFTTDGNFKKVCEVDNALYALVERTVDSTAQIYLEKMEDSDFYMDSYLAETSTPQTSITLDHLSNESVRVLTDGSVHANITLNGSGVGTLSGTFTNVSAGLHYESNIETLPATVIIQNQYSQRGEQVTKKRADIILQNTQALTFDGYDVTFQTLNNTTVSASPTSFSGTKLVFLSGTGVDLTVTANCTLPLPATILGATVEYKVPLTLES
jgi:hypothetical protein